jgi:diapolycopene oxygenase
MHALARALETLLIDLGGRIHYGVEVAGVERSEGRLTAVRTANGEQHVADIVVANMEVEPFYERVCGEPRRYLDRLKKFEPSCSGLVMHLGVDRRYEQLAHHNVFYSADARRHFDSIFKKRILSEDPTIYLVAPCKTDAALAPPGCEVIKVLPHIPHLKDERPFAAEDYAALRERVLVKLERMGLTDLRRHIVVEKTWTPHDIERLYYSNRGSIYGTVSDRKKNLGFKAPQRSDRYRNLYFVGGSVNPGGGMPMVTLSGQLVRDKIQQDLATSAREAV